jgi:glycosyltransferase involved in cell wall biosynthesis
VLEAIVALYPDAEIVTPWNNAPHRFPDRKVHQLWLAQSLLRGRKAASVAVLASAWRSAVPQEASYEWILASSHLFSHHIRPRGRSAAAPKLVYAYTPARYIWTPEMDARGGGMGARAASALLRPLDRRRAKEATAVAGISQFVKQRIESTWGVEATVVYPPVETTFIQGVADWRSKLTGDELRIIDSLPDDFALGASRFIPYKRLDLVIAAGEHVGLPVVLAGGGPERSKLQAQAEAAKIPVIIVDDPSSALLFALYQAAAVFVFPPVEDFGIMPIEAMALGTPAVGSWIGGSAETITENVSGAHFDSPSASDISAAIDRALRISPESCRVASSKFSRESFDTNFANWMEVSLAKHGISPR